MDTLSGWRGRGFGVINDDTWVRNLLENLSRIRKFSFFTHRWTQLWPLMNTSAGIIWNNSFFSLPFDCLPSYYSNAEGGKRVDNNTLQSCAWLICRINETTCFSRKPKEKKKKEKRKKMSKVCGSCICMLNWNMCLLAQSLRLCLLSWGCWMSGEGESRSLLMFLCGTGLIWAC